MLASPDAFTSYADDGAALPSSPSGRGRGGGGETPARNGGGGEGSGGVESEDDEEGLVGSVIPFNVFRRLLQRLFESIATPWCVGLAWESSSEGTGGGLPVVLRPVAVDAAGRV